MKDVVIKRIKELKDEFATQKQTLEALNKAVIQTRATLSNLSATITELQDLLAAQQDSEENPPTHSSPSHPNSSS